MLHRTPHRTVVLDKDTAFARYTALGEAPRAVSLPVSIRINTLKITPEHLRSRLRGVGIEVEHIPFLRYGYRVTKAKFSVGASLEYLMGYLYTQETASQLAVQVLDPLPGEVVADLAAAPGGKTTQIAQWMNNQGVVIALDKGERVYALRNNLERCGVSNTVILKKDARFIKEVGLRFDRILLDAPCSANFVADHNWFGKHPLQRVQERASLQQGLIRSASSALKPNGVLVYSTCSLEPEENEMVVDGILRSNRDLRLEPVDIPGSPGLTAIFGKVLHPQIRLCRRLWPWRTGTQGFFIARFRKVKS